MSSAGIPVLGAFTWSYLKTLPGILKGIAVIFGLLAMAFVAFAYDTAPYYHAIYNYESDCKTSRDPDLEGTTCPTKWLVTLAVIFIGVTWAVSLLLLVLMLFSNVVQYLTKIAKIDVIVHSLFAVTLLVSVVFIIVFVVMIYAGKFPCTESKEKKVNYDYCQLEIVGHSYGRVVALPTYDQCKDCESARRWVFQHIYLLIGVGFATVAACLFIVAGALGTRQKPIVFSTMPPAGSQAHSAADSRQQQQSSPAKAPAPSSEPVPEDKKQEEGA